MADNELNLIYRYGESTVKVLVMSGEKVAFEVDVCDMLRMSQGRPWSLKRMKFDIVDVADENGTLTILLENGMLMVMLTVYINADNDLSFECEWRNTSQETIFDVMFGIAIPVELNSGCKLILPPLLYHNAVNENGDLDGKCICHGGYVVEEHRYTIPVVSVAEIKRAQCTNIALMSCPSKCEENSCHDNEWSLGVVQNDDAVFLTVLSGGVMYEGVKDKVLGGNNCVCDYERGYFDFEADASIIKNFVISGWNKSREHGNVSMLIEKAYEMYKPKNEIEINYGDFLRYKGIALKNRYVETDNLVGYVKELSAAAQEDSSSMMHYESVKKEWTVDNLCAAWCDALNSLRGGMKEGILRAKKCVDFYITSSECKKRGLRQLYYNCEIEKWSYSSLGDVVPSGEYGRMLSYLADIISLFKEHCLEVPDMWIEALEDSCNFLCGFRKMTKMGLFPDYWNSDGEIGTNSKSATGVACVAALAKAYKITQDRHYIAAAAKALVKYYEGIILKHKLLTKKSKYDEEDINNCDKEAYINFIDAALNCYDVTREDRYIKMATAAAEILTLYVNVINYPPEKESKLAKFDFDMRGLSKAGLSESYDDVIFPSYSIKKVAEITGNSFFNKISSMTVNASTQLVSTGDGEYGFIAVGEHPGKFYFTNWSENCEKSDWRGGYDDINSLKSLVWSFRQVLKITNLNYTRSIYDDKG